MSMKENGRNYEDLPLLLEEEFPYQRLVQWALGIVEKGNIPLDQRGKESLYKITRNKGFNEISSKMVGFDISVQRPSTGEVIEILHGSYFYLGDLEVLEDEALLKALAENREYTTGVVPRDVFLTSMMEAGILIGSIIIPHGLAQDEIVQIAKQHCLREIIYNPQAGDVRESAFLLYAAMKVVANRLGVK